MKIFTFWQTKEKKLVGFFLLFIIFFGVLLRINNVITYNSWWADDGGAHVMYIEDILYEHRLPTMQENYLAWHEPLYYAGMSVWSRVGIFLGFEQNLINWQELSNIFLYLIFLYVVWRLVGVYTKNDWLVLLLLFIASFLFTGVKLSAYLNNEYIVQILILLLIFLFGHWQLWQEKKERLIIYWSVILGVAMLFKLTAVLVLLGAFALWGIYFLIEKKKQVLFYILIALAIVLAINSPWLIYKNKNFGTAFTINIYENDTKQSILNSQAWDYIFDINTRVLVNQPFWYTLPHSFSSILLADTFADYYNLFNHVDLMNSLPEKDKILTTSNRFTTPLLWQANLNSIRVGFVISIIWLIGFFGFLINRFKKSQIDWYELFLFIMLVGGFLALIYNNLRHPYLERGVLKASFIYYVFTLLSLLTYGWWWQILQGKILKFVILFLPWLLYLYFIWPVLWVL